jgi:cytochrome c oxidase assembly protein subunit 11
MSLIARFKNLSKNAKLGLACGAFFFAMVGAAFAAVPLYKMFCQATGYNGTVRQAANAPRKVLDRKVQIRFDTNVRDVPFKFTAEQTTQSVRIGDTGLAFFKVTNTSNHPVTARAAYNVLPEQAGAYFQKLECFCFTEQTLKAGEKRDMAVVFYVDPAMAKDSDGATTNTITLSYTFYPQREPSRPVADSAPAVKPGPI